jgi:alanyl-tRNA synthetase
MSKSANSKHLSSQQIRETFLSYFEKNGHSRQPSSSLIPENDATLLFANAGMNQFKNLFLGLEQRPYKRATTSQKCVRAGGKHNDLENVGFTARHHTFFEMLGNFSFGDYFKKDAIHFAWDLLTKEFGIPREKLYVTVFETDDEAADIWHKQEGVPRDRIYRFGEKDNFWRMGDTGPCGPCTEIFYDHGPDADDPQNPSTMGGDGDRYVEIWNLVFMQYNEDESGRHPLPKPSVDTGGGLERFTAALQGKFNNYDTDLFAGIIDEATRISKCEYITDMKVLASHAQIRETTAALRVIADHSRATAFLIADGVMPSNEGRGYVLRRILRRAIRYGRKLTDDPTLFEQTVGAVITEMSPMYPELKRQKNVILSNVRDEVSRFLTTLDQGTEIFASSLKKLGERGQKTVDGELVFKLYDTFGFPVDLTKLMAAEKGFSVDEEGFEKHMDSAREKAKSSWKGKALSSDAAHLVQVAQKALDLKGPTQFLGYTNLQASGQLLLASNGFEMKSSLSKGETGLFVFNQTPFYAEGGGQVGDHGTIQHLTGVSATAEVLDCSKVNEVFLHSVKVLDGTFKTGETYSLQVVDSKRRNTAANHSATHLLHAALREVLGAHVTQAGSSVDPERLRFDFTHNKPLSENEIIKIEELVNNEIARATDVDTKEMSHKEAIASGALALFGEKYGDKVRVIRMGDFSTELCGGTHVRNTSFIRVFKIVSENGVSSGVRRIEAVTGDIAFQFMLKNTRENLLARAAAGIQENWLKYLTAEVSGSAVKAASSAILAPTTMSDYIEHSKQTVRNLERELQAARGSSINLEAMLKESKTFSVNGQSGRIVAAYVDMDDRKVLSEISDKLKDKLQSGVVVLVGKGAGAHPIIVTVSKDLSQSLNAGKILGEIAAELGGKGGGRPDFAQGSVADISKLANAFKKAHQLVGL